MADSDALFVLFSLFFLLFHFPTRFSFVETSAIDLKLQHNVQNGLIRAATFSLKMWPTVKDSKD